MARLGCIRQLLGLRPQPIGVTQGSPSVPLRNSAASAVESACHQSGASVLISFRKVTAEGAEVRRVFIGFHHQRYFRSSICIMISRCDDGDRSPRTELSKPSINTGFCRRHCLVPPPNDSGNNAPSVVTSVVYQFLMDSRTYAPPNSGCTRLPSRVRTKIKATPESDDRLLSQSEWAALEGFASG